MVPIKQHSGIPPPDITSLQVISLSTIVGYNH